MGKKLPQFKLLLFSAISLWPKSSTQNVLFLQVENEEVTRRILNDPVSYTPSFSKEAKDICEGLMEKDPVKRLGFKNNDCTELKNQLFFREINWGRLEAGG